jgi:hypothetical protein
MIINNYVDHQQSTTEKTVFRDLPIGERPEMEAKTSLIYVVAAVLIGTSALTMTASSFCDTSTCEYVIIYIKGSSTSEYW